MKAFAESSSPSIVVRGSWLSEGDGKSTLELTEAEPLFLALTTWLGTDGNAETGLEGEANAASLSLLSKIKLRLPQALQSERFSQLVVMRLDDQAGIKRPVSLSDLRRASEEKRLFMGTPVTNRDLPVLAAALPRVQFLVLRNPSVQAILQDADMESILTFGQPHKDVISSLVLSTTLLGDEAERIALIKVVGLGDPKYRMALRILAAGRVEARDEKIMLRIAGRNIQGLDGLMQRLLAAMNDVIIISTRVAESFGAAELRNTLSIAEMDEDDVGALLERHANLLTRVSPTPEEVAGLFRSRIDRDRLARLPLFVDVEGSLCPAVDLIKELPNYPVPASLRPCVRFANPAIMHMIPGGYCDAIPEWSPQLQIETALETSVPAQHCQAILDAVQRLNGTPNVSKLRKVRWLTDAAGQGFAPTDVLDLDDRVAEAAARILPPGTFLRISELDQRIVRHPAIDILRRWEVLLGRGSAQRRLVELVTDARVLALLPGHGRYPLKSISQLAELGLQLDLPGWPLMSALVRDAGVEHIVDPSAAFAAPKFEQIETLRKAFARLRAIGQQPEAFDAVVVVYAYVFSGLALQPEAIQHQVLQGLQVPTRAGGWADAAHVAVNAGGIQDGSLLHPKLADVWIDVEGTNTDELSDSLVEHVRQSAHGLTAAKSFSEAVRHGVPVELLFLFFALIGIDPKAVGLHQNGEGASAAEIRDELIEAMQRFAASQHMGTYDVFLSRRRVTLQPSKPGLVRCKSLAGPWVELPKASSGNTLLLGNGHQRPSRHGLDRDITLTYDGAILEPSYSGDLVEVLAEAIPIIAHEALGIERQYLEKLKPLVEKARHVDQTTVEATVRLLISGLPLMLKQVKPEPDGLVQKALREANKHLGALARKGDDPAKVHEVHKRLYNALKCETAHSELLRATRRKISEMGYSPRRIFFELFQNADDAAVQASRGKAAFQIEHRTPQGEVDIVHWGRPINDFSQDPVRGREQQYDADLLNMLQLNTSTKQQKDGVTGHFGLGFKSVHLVSRSVLLASGLSIATRISGGFLPENWEHGLAEVRRLSRPEALATLIRLELDPECKAQAKEALDAFCKAATVLPALGRSIRKIVIDGTNHECILALDDKAKFMGVAVTSADKLRMLRIQLDENSTLLLRLDDRGPVAFDSAIAGLWSLAPLEEGLGSGWIIDIRGLPLDPGRTRLKESPVESAKRFATLGSLLADRLISLHKMSEADWPGMCRALNLPHAADEAGRSTFWRRLVELFRKDLAHPLTRHLHGPDRGLGLLVKQRAVLASGLAGAFEGVVAGDEVRWCVTGELTTREMQESISGWEAVKSKIGHVISADIAELLKELGFPRPSDLRLTHLLDEELRRDPKIPPARAAALGEILSDTRLKKFREQEEQWSLRTALGTGLFEMEDGNYIRARLSARAAPRDEGDEVHLLDFAPPSVVAAPGYASGRGLDLYRSASAQSGMVRSADVYAKWISEAQAGAAREGGLRYLIEGNLGTQTAEKLRDALPAWVGRGPDDLRTNVLLAKWKSVDITRLSILLFPRETDQYGNQPVIAPVPTQDNRALLEEIHQWWEKYGASAGQDYDAQSYPSDFHPRQLIGREAEDDRDGWFTFFALGMFRVIGWSSPSSNRGFVVEARRQGWWSQAAQGGVRLKPDAWQSWLENVAFPSHSHIKYLDWHRRIVDLNLLSTYLPDYVMAFQRLPALVSHKGSIRLRDALAPSNSSDWGKLGLEGGPLGQSLGIGANWMIREALRHGIWKGEEAALMQPYAWSTTRRLRSLLSPYGDLSLGERADMDQSSAIFGFVTQHLAKRASFRGDFDLPLQLAATSGHKLYNHLTSRSFILEDDLAGAFEQEAIA